MTYISSRKNKFDWCFSFSLNKRKRLKKGLFLRGVSYTKLYIGKQKKHLDIF